MDIITALKTKNIRISCVNSWLVWSDQDSEWIVYERKPYAKKNTCLYTGQSFENAIDILVEEVSNETNLQ